MPPSVLPAPPTALDVHHPLHDRQAWHRDMAHRLHDGALQRLTAAQLLLDTAELDLGAHPALGAGRSAVRDAAVQLRALLVDDEAPEALSATELSQVLADMAAEVSPDARVVVHVPPGRRMAVRPHTILLRRIAQELLANVVTHAGQRLRHLILLADGEGLVLEVADGGPGGCPEDSPAGHFGLSSVREDVEERGGTVEIASTPGGTTVTVSLRT